MTREKWAKLTPEEQRIKVAECCGWENIYTRKPHVDGTLVGYMKSDDGSWRFGGGCSVIPDYLNDLNAMHEAEKIMSLEQKRIYVLKLIGDAPLIDAGVVSCMATAAQRAEAFVLTLEPE